MPEPPVALVPLPTAGTYKLSSDTAAHSNPAAHLFSCEAEALTYLRRLYPCPPPLTRLHRTYSRIAIYPPYLDLQDDHAPAQLPAVIARDGFVLIDPDDRHRLDHFLRECPHLTIRSRREHGLLYLYSAPKLIARRAAREKAAALAKVSSGSYDLSDIRPIAEAFYYAIDKSCDDGLISFNNPYRFYTRSSGWGRGDHTEGDAKSDCLTCIEAVTRTLPLLVGGLSKWRIALAKNNSADLFSLIRPYLPGMLLDDSDRRVQSVAKILVRESRLFTRLKNKMAAAQREREAFLAKESTHVEA